VIKNVTGIANLMDSTSGRTAAQTLQQVNALFDSNASTGSDFRNGSSGSGSGSYIIFDFKAGNQATLTNVELLARQDQYYTRINGAVVQGSNDNSTWTTLTKAAVSTQNWQTLAVSSKVPYRYIKIVNPNTWYGNMNEVRFHGVVKPADVTAPVTTDNAPQGWVNQNTTVSLTAVDDSSGVAVTYYTVDGGSKQTGNSVTLTTDGTHTIAYWSVDWAGNVEQPHTVALNVDNTAPVTTAAVEPALPDSSNGWYDHAVTVSLSVYDNLSGVAKTEYSLDGGATWQPYTSAITFDKEGKNTVSYRSTDNAGNIETVKTVNVNLDLTAPVTTAAVSPAAPEGQNGWYVHPVTVTLSANDNLSGVAKTEYSLDGGSTWQAYTAPVTLSQDSKYTVSYRSTDVAGNVEAAKTISFNLDQTAPTITVTGLVYGTYTDSTDITPILTLSDNLSGVDSSKTTVTLSTYGVQQTVQQGATIPLYTLPLGEHTFIVTASDMAGNTGSQTITFQTATSIQSLQALVTRFTTAGWIDNAGIANSLQSKLAVNDLADFVSEVQAQSGKHISAQAAGYLLRDARYVLSNR
jgi:hypothetical protein